MGGAQLPNCLGENGLALAWAHVMLTHVMLVCLCVIHKCSKAGNEGGAEFLVLGV